MTATPRKTLLEKVSRKLALAAAITALITPLHSYATDNNESYCQSAGEENNFDCGKSATFQADQQAISDKLNELNRWLEDEERAQSKPLTSSRPDSPSLQKKIDFNTRLLADELKQARKLQNSGDTQGAFNQVNTYLASNPKDPNGWLLYGISLINQNKLTEAGNIFSKLIKLYPDSPEAYNNLAVVYARKGDNEKAVATLLQAFETHPSYAQVQANLKTVYATLATQAYNRALNLENKGTQARADLAILDQVYQPPGILPATAEPQLQVAAAAPVVVQPKAEVKKPEPAVSVAEVTEPVIEERDVSEGVVPQIDDTPEQPVKAEMPPQKADDKNPPATLANTTAAKTETPVVVADTTTKQPGSVLTDQLATDITQLITGWASAWSAQNVPDYLSFYTEQYSPDSSVTHKQWAWGRNKRLQKPEYIKIAITDISLAETSDGRVRSVFRQRYESDTYQDEVFKTLIFTNQNGSWKIATESTL